MSKLQAIFAVASNGAFGHAGGLPWPRLPEDLPRFKQLTVGHAIIMGRRTYESLKRPLPLRRNLVVSSSCGIAHQDVGVYRQPLDALSRAYELDDAPFVIGGACLLRALWPLVQIAHITRVHAVYPGADTRLPLDWCFQQDFEERERVDLPADEKWHPAYSFLTLARVARDARGQQ